VVQVAGVDAKPQRAMPSGTASGRAMTTWEPRRHRGESWRARGLPEYAQRVGRTMSADAVGDGEIGISRMCASTSAGSNSRTRTMRARNAVRVPRGGKQSQESASARISPAIVRKDVKLANSRTSSGSEQMQMQMQQQKQMQMQPYG